MKLNAEIEIHVLDEKIRFLKLKIAEKQRQIYVTQKLVPIKRALDADVAVLQIQVGTSCETLPGTPLHHWSVGCMLLHVNWTRLLLDPVRTHELWQLL